MLQIMDIMLLWPPLNSSVMFLISHIRQLLKTLQPVLISHLVRTTVKILLVTSISELLDTCQHHLLKMSGLPEVHLTLNTPLQLLVILLLKLPGMLMLLFLRRMPRWMHSLLPSHHQKHQQYHHFQICHGPQLLTLDMLSNLFKNLLWCTVIKLPLLSPPHLSQPLENSGIPLMLPNLLVDGVFGLLKS